jgi:hypothetical protein
LLSSPKTRFTTFDLPNTWRIKVDPRLRSEHGVAGQDHHLECARCQLAGALAGPGDPADGTCRGLRHVQHARHPVRDPQTARGVQRGVRYGAKLDGRRAHAALFDERPLPGLLLRDGRDGPDGPDHAERWIGREDVRGECGREDRECTS